MNIGTNSLLGKFYIWFWFTNKPNPKDLPQDWCVFRQKILVSFIFCIPLFILTLPLVIVEKLNKNLLKKFLFKMDIDGDYDIPKGISGLVIYLSLYMSYCVILLFLVLFNIIHIENNDSMNNFNLLFGGIAIMIGACCLILLIVVRLSKKLSEEEKPSSKTKELYKAYKNKYCFKIHWN